MLILWPPHSSRVISLPNSSPQTLMPNSPKFLRLEHTIRELRRLPYRPLESLRISRERFCLHPFVQQAPGGRQTPGDALSACWKMFEVQQFNTPLLWGLLRNPEEVFFCWQFSGFLGCLEGPSCDAGAGRKACAFTRLYSATGFSPSAPTHDRRIPSLGQVIYPMHSMGLEYMLTLTPLATPQLIGIYYGSPMECVGIISNPRNL